MFVATRLAPIEGDRDAQNNVILVFDTSLHLVEILSSSPPIRDVHQILFHDGVLVVTSTFDDAVMLYSFDDGCWSVVHPFGRQAEQDQHHINSVFPAGKGFFLAGNKPSGWVAHMTRTGDLLPGSYRPLGAGSHNVWLEGGDIWVCSSGEAALRSCSGQFISVVDRGWVRGLATDGQYKYVGVSQNLVRDARNQSDSMVVKLDQDGRQVTSFSFFGYGMVLDIRTLGSDPSHNGLRFEIDDAPDTTRCADYFAPAHQISLSPDRRWLWSRLFGSR